MEEEIVVPEDIETPEVVEEETLETPEEVEESAEDKISRLEQEKAELEDKNKKLYARVAKTKEEKPQKVEPSNEELSPKDLYTLMSAQVPQEDVDEVIRASKALNVPLAEALKSPIVKGILAEREEQRKTSQATQTRGGARGSVKVSGADLLAKAERTGELPDTDEGMAALAQARMMRNLGKK
jgi:hypothetical protein